VGSSASSRVPGCWPHLGSARRHRRAGGAFAAEFSLSASGRAARPGPRQERQTTATTPAQIRTASDDDRSASGDVDIAPATRFRRQAIGIVGVVGGLLTAAGFATTVWETAAGTQAYHDSLVVDPLRSQIAALLLHFGYFGIVPVLLVLGIMTRRRLRVVGNIGLALSMGGALALPGLLVTDFYDIAIRQSLPPEQAAAVSDAAAALPLAAFVGGPLIMALFVGMTVLGFAAWRAGFFHWTFASLVAVSFVVPFVTPIGMLQGISQGAFLALFMVAAGVAALRMTDEEWVSGARGAGRS
jgi:hypothetical protein